MNINLTPEEVDVIRGLIVLAWNSGGVRDPFTAKAVESLSKKVGPAPKKLENIPGKERK